MRSIHYIGTGMYGVSFVYYYKIDKLYGVSESVQGYNLDVGFFEPRFPVGQRLIAYLILMPIMILSFIMPHKYLQMIASLNVLQCMVVSIIVAILYRSTEMEKTIEKLSNGNRLVEIPFEETIRGHYDTLISHTSVAGLFVVGFYAVSIVTWINRFELDKELSNGDMSTIIWFLLLFVLSGLFCSVIDPIGRIKLICRIRKEKRKIRREKRRLEKEK